MIGSEADKTSEHRWLEQAQAGDCQAFGVLYRIHHQRVYALCVRFLAERELAEDALQNSFVQAWRKLHSFRGESSFGSWLRRIAINQCLALQRKQRFWLLFSNDKVDVHPAVGVDESTGVVDDLERAVSSLPARSRQVLVLHDIEGYTHEEIAGQLKMAVGTSKAQLHRARKRLQELLKDERA